MKELARSSARENERQKKAMRRLSKIGDGRRRTLPSSGETVRNARRLGPFREEAVDPGLEAAAKGKLCPEHLVLTKNEKERSYRDA
jgi:hypothetical protein